MPYISVTTDKKLTPEVMEAVKTELGKSISVIPGKDEGSLMVSFDNAVMYHAGQKADSAFICVKIFSTTTKEAFKNFNTEIARIMSDCAGITKIYVNFEEHLIWGSSGHFLG